MRRETSDIQTKITLSPRARAQIDKTFIERTIAKAWGEVEGEMSCYEGRAEFAVDALNEAGFEVVRKNEPVDCPAAFDQIRLALAGAHHRGVTGKPYNFDTDARALMGDLAQAGIGVFPIANYVPSRDDVIRRMGAAPAKIHREIAEEQARARALGISHPFVDPLASASLEAGDTIQAPLGTEIRSAEPAATVETEKAARWASVLIAQILDEGSARQVEAGVEVAAKDALGRLKRDRGRVAFEDIDWSPPMAASLASEAVATWVRSLGEAVVWCDLLLAPRRIVLTASLRSWPDREQSADINRRLEAIREFRGVVGADLEANATGEDAEGVDVRFEIRFDHYITTVGCNFAPLDLPGRPREAA